MVGELYKFGGASEIMEILTKGLENDGHAVTLLYGYNYDKHDVESKSYVLFNNALLRRINNRFRYYLEKYNLRNLYAYGYVRFLIWKKRIDIIHFHALQGGFLCLNDIRKICKTQNVIWTVHDTWPITGGCMYYWDCLAWQNSACEICKETDIRMKYENTAINWKRKKSALQNKGIYYVAPSRWMLTNMRQSFLSKERLELIENGINIQIFKPLDNIEDIKLKYKVDINKKILMFSAGNVNNKYKGWKYLRDALFQLDDKKEYELLIVGKETEELDDMGISMIKMGFVQDKSVLNELYNIADIFILPSVQDNFPTVTLEAQAAGTPVLAFTVGGIREQIVQETGWLIDDINADGLRKAIEQIFCDKNWAENLKEKGKMARKRSEVLYDERLMIKRYEEVYFEKQKNAENRNSGERK